MVSICLFCLTRMAINKNASRAIAEVSRRCDASREHLRKHGGACAVKLKKPQLKHQDWYNWGSLDGGKIASLSPSYWPNPPNWSHWERNLSLGASKRQKVHTAAMAISRTAQTIQGRKKIAANKWPTSSLLTQFQGPCNPLLKRVTLHLRSQCCQLFLGEGTGPDCWLQVVFPIYM